MRDSMWPSVANNRNRILMAQHIYSKPLYL